MNEGLLQLLQLQEVDKSLKILEEAKDRYPAEINDRQSELDRARTGLEEQENTLDELARQQRQSERELESFRVSLQEHEERFAAVTTNKEYDALQLEIEVCKGKISACETRILEIIETTENMQEQVETARGDYEEIHQTQQARIDELQTRLTTLQGEVDSVEAQRQTVMVDISQNLLQAYERSRKQKGLRVGAVKKGACGVCFRQLPAQQKSNVRHNPQVYFCESCGAILAWDTEST